MPLDRQNAPPPVAVLSAPSLVPHVPEPLLEDCAGAVTPRWINTCAVVVTYHPDPALFDRLKLLFPQVQRMVIVDNGSSDEAVSRLREIASHCACHLILNRRNEGIARALNLGAQWAIAQGSAWILMLDQDTTVSPHILHSMGDIFLRDASPATLAIIGSNYTHKATGELNAKFAPAPSPQALEMVSVLTSGSLLSLAAYGSLGPFRDDFFIDCVDHEYCLRARSRGFRVVMTCEAVMIHGIGHLTRHRFLWKTVGASNHEPARQYFMARNTWALAKEYLLNEPRWILKYLWAWLKSLAVICLFEHSRARKLRHIARGCVDGLLGRAATGSESSRRIR